MKYTRNLHKSAVNKSVHKGKEGGREGGGACSATISRNVHAYKISNIPAVTGKHTGRKGWRGG